MKPSFRRVRLGLGLLVGLTAAAVAGHRLLSDSSLVDSLYWAVITIAKVGYGERPDPVVGTGEKLFAVAVILLGTVVVAYTAAVFVQAVVEGQLQQALGARRMTREISRLHDHVIICGFGRTGQHLADRLKRQEVDFVVVDSSDAAIEDARQAGHLCMTGDATSEETLLTAGIERAKTLVAALHDDADNVFLTLTARDMKRDLAILARGEQPSTEKKLMQAGANQVILPAVIGAQQLADIILRPHAARLLHGVGHATSASLDADMEEVQIPASSSLVGKKIRDADTRKSHDVLIVSIRRSDGSQVFNPGADVVLQAGDTLIVIGQSTQVREFRKAFGAVKTKS
jgi:voltage-gated potassium channel